MLTHIPTLHRAASHQVCLGNPRRRPQASSPPSLLQTYNLGLFMPAASFPDQKLLTWLVFSDAFTKEITKLTLSLYPWLGLAKMDSANYKFGPGCFFKMPYRPGCEVVMKWRKYNYFTNQTNSWVHLVSLLPCHIKHLSFVEKYFSHVKHFLSIVRMIPCYILKQYLPTEVTCLWKYD